MNDQFSEITLAQAAEPQAETGDIVDKARQRFNYNVPPDRPLAKLLRDMGVRWFSAESVRRYQVNTAARMNAKHKDLEAAAVWKAKLMLCDPPTPTFFTTLFGFLSLFVGIGIGVVNLVANDGPGWPVPVGLIVAGFLGMYVPYLLYGNVEKRRRVLRKHQDRLEANPPVDWKRIDLRGYFGSPIPAPVLGLAVEIDTAWQGRSPQGLTIDVEALVASDIRDVVCLAEKAELDQRLGRNQQAGDPFLRISTRGPHHEFYYVAVWDEKGYRIEWDRKSDEKEI